MTNLRLSVVDIWDDGTRIDNPRALENPDGVLDTMGRVEAGEWPTLVSSRVWLVEESAGHEGKVLIWEWIRS